MSRDCEQQPMTASLRNADKSDRRTPHLRLECQVLAAFMRAKAEGRPEVAEHLMRALEALCSGMAPGEPAAQAPPLVATDVAFTRWN